MKSDKYILIITNLVISLVLCLMFSNFGVAVVNTIGLLVVLVLLKKDDNNLYKHVNIIYVICVTLMLALYFGYLLKYDAPYYLGGSDDRNFEVWAEQAIESNNYTINDINNNNLFKNYNCNGFIWLVSLLIRFGNLFGGYHTVMLRLINIYLLIFIGLLAYKYFYKNESKKHALRLLYITTLFPNALYISIHGFRDTLFAFLIFSIFYLTSDIKERNLKHKIWIIIYTIFITYIAYHIREEAILYIFLIILLNLFFNKKNINIKNFDIKNINKKNVQVALLIIFASIAIVLKLGIFEEIQKYIERYNNHILNGESGLASIVFLTPFFPFGFILRIIYGLIFPSPTGLFITQFDIDGISKLFLSLGTIIQIYLLPYIFKNIKRIDKILIIYVIMFLSIVFTTFGFRHFIMLYPFMFILILREVMKTKNNERKKMFKIVSLVGIFGLIFYVIFKII